MAIFRTETPILASRPIRQLIDLWMVLVLFVAMKCMPHGVSKQAILEFAMLGLFFLAVWMLGRRTDVRRICENLLGERSVDVHLLPRDAAYSREPAHLWLAPGLSSPARPWRSGWQWLVAGFAFCCGILALLQWRQNHYFVQDDNLAQFLPVIIQGCRSFFDDGLFPNWNPYQFLGSPTASIGTYALTYPPTYGSYAVARWVLGNEYATVDVFCIAHLLAGYLTTYWACRVIGIRPSVSAGAGTCFTLLGFFLIAGRSWYYMTPTAAWAPLTVGLLERFRRQEVNWKWVLTSGIVIGCMFHSGNAQMWAYTVLLFGIGMAILILCRAVPRAQSIPAMSALILGMAIAMPLLLPQFLETFESERKDWDGAMLRYWPAIFLPYPLAEARYPGVTETPDLQHMGHLYYSGTVFSVVAAIGMLSLLAYRWRRSTVVHNVWCILAWISLLFAIGRVGILWYLMAKVPPFTGFTHAFKFMPFVTLFMVTGGAVMIERGLARSKNPRRWEWRLTALVAVLMTYHAVRATPSFCDYGFKPFADLPAEIEALRDGQSPQRLYAIGPRRSLAPEFGLSMMHQLPTIYRWHAFEGYDPLVRRSPRYGAVMDKLFTPARTSGIQIELGAEALGLEEPSSGVNVEAVLKRTGMEEFGFWGRTFRIQLPQALQALQAYGVRWVAIYSGPQKPRIGEGHPNEMFWRTDPVPEQIGEMVKERGRLVLRRPEVQIYELRGVSPMAFAAAKSRKPLPVELDASGVEVDLSSLTEGGEVVVNVVDSQYFKASTEAGPIDRTTDKWGRLVFNIPPGSTKLMVKYVPPWLPASLLGAVFGGLAISIMKWRKRVEGFMALLWQKRPGAPPAVVPVARPAKAA